jgi:hypothetical protein
LPATPDPILYSDDAKLLECHRGYGCRFWIVGLSRKDPKASALAWPEINGINPVRSFTDKPRMDDSAPRLGRVGWQMMRSTRQADIRSGLRNAVPVSGGRCGEVIGSKADHAWKALRRTIKVCRA